MASHDDLSALRAQHDAATSAAPLPWSLVLRTVDTGDGDGDRDVLDANGEVVTWIDGRSAVAELIVGAVNMLRELMDAADERDRLRAEVDRLAALAGEAADVIKAYEERDYAEGRGKPEKLRAAIGKGPEL